MIRDTRIIAYADETDELTTGSILVHSQKLLCLIEKPRQCVYIPSPFNPRVELRSVKIYLPYLLPIEDADRPHAANRMQMPPEIVYGHSKIDRIIPSKGPITGGPHGHARQSSGGRSRPQRLRLPIGELAAVIVPKPLELHMGVGAEYQLPE
jgi:hypothetical protein